MKRSKHQPTIEKSLKDLSTSELDRLAALVADQIAARKMQEAIVTDVLTPAARAKAARKSTKRDHSATWIETKEVDGHLYRYERWWENGKKRSKYLGKA